MDYMRKIDRKVDIKISPSESTFVIGSNFCSELYRLNILKENIND